MSSINTRFTLADLVTFAHDHYPKLSWIEHGHRITEAASKNKLYYMSTNSRVSGIAIATVFRASKVLYLHYLVTIPKGLREFILYARQYYSGYGIAGHRNKQGFVRYNFNKQ